MKEEDLEEEEDLERAAYRVSRAVEAMKKELQLPSSIVMPILLKLIEAYDGKWEHIEADGYRLLADMIFQQQEAV